MPDETTNELLRVLANEDCRRVLACLRTRQDDTIPVRALAAQLRADDMSDPDQLATRLHHNVLPKLEDVGVIEYDTDTDTILYVGHAELEALFDAIQTVTQPEESSD